MSINKEVPGCDNPIENPNYNKQAAVDFQMKILDAKPYGLVTAFHVRYDRKDSYGVVYQTSQAVENRAQLPADAVNTEEFEDGAVEYGPYIGKGDFEYEDYHTHGKVLAIHGGIPIAHRRVK